MLEDNAVGELLDGHGDLGQSEDTPALNDGVYDRWCLCKLLITTRLLTTTTVVVVPRHSPMATSTYYG